MKTYWGVEIYLNAITSALDGVWSASRPSRFTSGVGVRGIHWIGGWMGHRASLHAVKKAKIPIIAPGEN